MRAWRRSRADTRSTSRDGPAYHDDEADIRGFAATYDRAYLEGDAARVDPLLATDYRVVMEGAVKDRGAALSFALPARVHDGAPTSGSGDWASYAWSWSGLLRYEVAGSGANARLRALDPLVVDRSPGTDPLLAQRPWMDPAADGARSVLFPRGTVYVGDGRFWHQRADGVLTGPL